MTKKKEGEVIAVSYHEKLKSEDVVDWCRPLVENGGYQVRFGDGKIVAPMVAMFHDPPWHHVVQGDDRDCTLQTRVLWKTVFVRLDKPNWVPAYCQQCWKVVCRPPTLLGLFAIEKIQMRLGYSCKCGIEKRPWVHGNYGSYWYCSSLAEGKRRYAEVREAVDEDPLLGKDVPVLLKRGCTEFELKAGPSDKWEVEPGQEHVEELVKRYVDTSVNFSSQGPQLVTRVHKAWVEYAYSVGDPTYKYFTNGEPLFPPYVTYHEEATEKPSTSKSKGKKGRSKSQGE